MPEPTANEVSVIFDNPATKEFVSGRVKRMGRSQTPFTASIRRMRITDKNYVDLEVLEDRLKYRAFQREVHGARWRNYTKPSRKVRKVTRMEIKHSATSMSDQEITTGVYGMKEWVRNLDQLSLAHNIDREASILGSDIRVSQLDADLTTLPNADHHGSIIPTKSVAGQSPSFAALLNTHVNVRSDATGGATAGSVGGWNNTSKLYVAPTSGDPRELSFDMVENLFDDVWKIKEMTTGYMVIMNLPLRKKLNAWPSLFASRHNAAVGSDGLDVAVNAIGGIRTTTARFGLTLNSWMPVDAIYVADKSELELCYQWLNDPQYPPKTGDSREYVLRSHYGLKVSHEMTQGAILGVQPDPV